MAVIVVLAVGLDPWTLLAQDSVWRSEGYIVIPVYSIQDAIDHFNAGDFDLVLLGHSMIIENKERLTYLIRASGSNTPVVCISSSGEGCHTFADATLKSDPSDLLRGLRELLASRSRTPAALQVA